MNGKALTLDEACARAQHVWGPATLDVRLRPDGGADVAIVGVQQDTLPGNEAYHRLNADGHIACHAACFTLSDKRKR